MTTGVWVQDISATFSTMSALNRLVDWYRPPSRGEIECFLASINNSAWVGMILKLAGLALLFRLFFAKLHSLRRRKIINIKLPAVLGTTAAACFAMFALFPPVAGSGRWIVKAASVTLPFNLHRPGLNEMLVNYLTDVSRMTMGAFFLALALLLLGSTLWIYRRGTGKCLGLPISASALFMLAQRRAVSEEVLINETYISGWTLFSAMACAFSIFVVVAFIWALVVRNKKPRTISLLTIILSVSAGIAVLLFWFSLWGTSCGLSAFISQSEGYPAPWDLASAFFPHFRSMFWLSIVLLISSVVMPILCAFSLRLPQEIPQKTRTTEGVD